MPVENSPRFKDHTLNKRYKSEVSYSFEISFIHVVLVASIVKIIIYTGYFLIIFKILYYILYVIMYGILFTISVFSMKSNFIFLIGQ